MDENEALGVSAFEKLLARNVPHIIEKIFFSLDHKTFNECLQVCKTWNHLLISRSFRKVGKSAFHIDIQEELWGAIEEDNIDEVLRILSNRMAAENLNSIDISMLSKYITITLHMIGFFDDR